MRKSGTAATLSSPAKHCFSPESLFSFLVIKFWLMHLTYVPYGCSSQLYFTNSQLQCPPTPALSSNSQETESARLNFSMFGQRALYTSHVPGPWSAEWVGQLWAKHPPTVPLTLAKGLRLCNPLLTQRLGGIRQWEIKCLACTDSQDI